MAEEAIADQNKVFHYKR